MTTLGVDPQSVWRVDALRFPSYNYHYQALKEKQAKDYSNAINAKPVPIFRRPGTTFMKRQQLEQEALIVGCPATHGSGKYTKPPTIVPARPQYPITWKNIDSNNYNRWRHDTTPVVTTNTRREWSRFLDRCPERFYIQLPKEVNTGNIYFDGGYALRYLSPFNTRGVGLHRTSESQFEYRQGPADDSPFRSIKD